MSIFLFGVHMHQPVDNFDETVKMAVDKAYGPFFKLMREYEEIKFTLHCSGWLLQEIRTKYLSLYDDMLYLTQRGSIEWVSAGVYEPILSSIPKRDRKEQIDRLNSMIKEWFGVTPKGLWLTERVWESSIVEDILDSGIDYTVVDDYHFIASGKNKEELEGYFVTEEGGRALALFPISQELRYKIPFQKVSTAIEAIKSKKVAILFDDLEKFGLWPKTHDWVYKMGWLRNFLELIMKDKQIETMHYFEYLKSNRQKGLIYLPNLSYFEMGEWSLNVKDALELKELMSVVKGKKFIRGGIWKNFFIKYEESNRLHKRMIELSLNRVDSSLYKEALFRTQTNDVFWHGVFGGLYLPNLRDNAYRYICECENIRYKDKKALEISDSDMNGFDEVKCVEKDLIVRFDTHYGGQMIELLSRDTLFNFQNSLTRKDETYHSRIRELYYNPPQEISKDSIDTIHSIVPKVTKEIFDSLIYDWYIKNSFIDHISDKTLNLKTIKECSFWEYGDFANQPFEYRIDGDWIHFFRDGGIYFEKKYPTRIDKYYKVVDDSIEFKIDIKTSSPKEYIYAVEFNLHFAMLDMIIINGYNNFDEVEIEGIDSLNIVDHFTKKSLNILFNKEGNLFISPVKTVSQSEEGFELITQSLSIVFGFKLKETLSLKGRLELLDV